MKYELVDTYSETAVIKVIGVGGGGGNAVNHMIGCLIEGVEFICANTDAHVSSKEPSIVFVGRCAYHAETYWRKWRDDRGAK